MTICGMSELVITPPLGRNIPGYFAPRPAVGIKDDLFVKVAYFSDTNEDAFIIAIDACALNASIIRRIRSGVNLATAVQPSRILVSATHTHTGGPIELWSNIVETDDTYVEFLVERCAEAAELAFSRRCKVRLSQALGHETDIAFNRRYLMRDGSIRTNPGIGNPDAIEAAGPIDPDIPILSVDAMDGRTIGILSNYACHLDTVGGNEYSADYPGVISRFLKTNLGPDLVSLFMMGAAGNVNHVDVFKKTFDDDGMYPTNRHQRMGVILGAEIIKACSKARYMPETSPLHVFSTRLSLPVRQPTRTEIAWAHSIQARIRQDLDALDRFDPDQIDLFYAGEILKMSESKVKEISLDTEIQSISIGNFLVVGIPGELFVELGLEIKARFPASTVCVSTLANDSIGYILPAAALASQAYEARLCSTSRLTSEAGPRIVESLEM